MQFRVPCPYDPKKFFFVSVITQGNENFEIDLGHNVPTTEYLFRKYDLDCSYGAACVNNTLIVIHSHNALKFGYFKLMVRDIIVNDLNATFGGLAYNDTIYIPGSVIAATANDLRYAHKDVLEYLEGTTVCLEGRVRNRQALEDLAKRFAFSICFSRRAPKSKDDELWSAWQNCGALAADWVSTPAFDEDEEEVVTVKKSSSKSKRVSCSFDECELFEDGGWVKEDLPSLPKHPYGGVDSDEHPNVRRKKEEEERRRRHEAHEEEDEDDFEDDDYDDDEDHEGHEGKSRRKRPSFDPNCDVCHPYHEHKRRRHGPVLNDDWFFDDLRHEDYGDHDHEDKKPEPRKNERRSQQHNWQPNKDPKETPRKGRRESRWF